MLVVSDEKLAVYESINEVIKILIENAQGNAPGNALENIKCI
jgi:hypothetical protein